jgi:hypothetical protein
MVHVLYIGLNETRTIIGWNFRLFLRLVHVADTRIDSRKIAIVGDCGNAAECLSGFLSGSTASRHAITVIEYPSVAITLSSSIQRLSADEDTWIYRVMEQDVVYLLIGSDGQDNLECHRALEVLNAMERNDRARAYPRWTPHVILASTINAQNSDIYHVCPFSLYNA